jgi:hypothetical protein
MVQNIILVYEQNVEEFFATKKIANATIAVALPGNSADILRTLQFI